MNRRRALLLAGIAALVGIGGTWLLSSPVGVLRSPPACAREIPLIASTRPGWVFQQHRHTLNGPGDDFADVGPYLIWNRRTGDAIVQNVTEEPLGSARFFIPTRYALLTNRRWARDPWIACLQTPGTRPTAYRATPVGAELTHWV